MASPMVTVGFPGLARHLIITIVSVRAYVSPFIQESARVNFWVELSDRGCVAAKIEFLLGATYVARCPRFL